MQGTESIPKSSKKSEAETLDKSLQSPLLLAELEPVDLPNSFTVVYGRERVSDKKQFHGLYIPEHDINGPQRRSPGCPRWFECWNPGFTAYSRDCFS